MPSNHFEDLKQQFYRARDEYVAALNSNTQALIHACQAGSADSDNGYSRACKDLEEKRRLYDELQQKLDLARHR